MAINLDAGFRENFIPGQTVSADESSVWLKGRVILRCYRHKNLPNILQDAASRHTVSLSAVPSMHFVFVINFLWEQTMALGSMSSVTGWI